VSNPYLLHKTRGERGWSVLSSDVQSAFILLGMPLRQVATKCGIKGHLRMSTIAKAADKGV
jgi:hypothetical protein